MLWGVMELDPFCQAPGLLGFKRFVERGQAVGIQVIQDQAHPDGVRIALIEHALDPPGPVFSRAMLDGRHMALAGQGFHFEKDLRHSVADVFMVHPRRPSRRTSQRGLDFSD